MRRRTALAAMLAAATIAVGLPAAAAPDLQDVASCATRTLDPQQLIECLLADGAEPQAVGLARLRAESASPPDVRFTHGFPRTVAMDVPARGATPVEQAENFLKDHAELYGQTDPNLATPVVGLGPEGTQTVRLYQTFRGVRVHGAGITVGIVRDRVRFTTGAMLTELNIDTDPELSQQDAEALALRSRRGTQNILGVTTLEIYDPSIAGEGAPGARLVWRVNVGGDRPAELLIDAMTGAVLKVEEAELEGYDLDLEDANYNSAANSGCYWWTSDDDWVGDEDGVLSEYVNDPDVGDAWWNAKHTYNFYAGTFGRDSWDNDGEELDVYVHAGVPNAQWVPGYGCELFEFADGFAKKDVMTHEFTHAVIADAGALGSSGQPGALNESYADIMASLHDGNWTMGETLAGGSIRSLSNPPTFNDPDQMSEFINTSSDSGGVHSNNGIPNKAHWLLANGGTFNGRTVQAIAKQKVAIMAYITMQTLGSATFLDARDMSVAFANLSSQGGMPWGPQFTTNDVCQVKNAFAAVELGSGDVDCDGTNDNADNDDDGDTILDGNDNCPIVSNPSQKDTDSDGKGDACDTDDDNDGVTDTADNCPLVSNPSQADSDNDGKGNACDDEDGDGVLDTVDNCKNNWNPNQSDIDGDGKGDACDPDMDGDGVPNDVDNCAEDYNPDQKDTDNGGWGDVCDPMPDSPINEWIASQNWNFTVQRAPASFWKIIYDLCAGGCPDDRRDQRQRVRFDVRGLTYGARVTITDDRGHKVAGDDIGGLVRDGGIRTYEFQPQGGARYVLNVSYADWARPGMDELQGAYETYTV